MPDFYGHDSASWAAQSACVACGKLVCSQCSVSNMDEQRHCLVCAGREQAGGVGWNMRRFGVF